MGSGKQRVAQLVDGLFRLGGRDGGRLLQRGAGIGALQEVGFHREAEVFLDPRRDTVGGAVFDRLRKDAAGFVQDRVGGLDGGLGEEAGEEVHGRRRYVIAYGDSSFGRKLFVRKKRNFLWFPQRNSSFYFRLHTVTQSFSDLAGPVV